MTARRPQVAAQRTARTIERLRGQLLGVFPARERALDFPTLGPLVLISHLQAPAPLPGIGARELENWLRERKVRHADKLAAASVPCRPAPA